MAQKEQIDQNALAAEWGLALDAEQTTTDAGRKSEANAATGTVTGTATAAGTSTATGNAAGDQTATQWATMLDDNSNHMQGGKGGAERILNQEEIDSLLGFSLADVSLNNNSGIRAIIDSAMVSYERLPMQIGRAHV